LFELTTIAILLL